MTIQTQLPAGLEKTNKSALTSNEKRHLNKQMQSCYQMINKIECKIRMKEVGMLILDFVIMFFGDKEALAKKKAQWMHLIDQCYVQRRVIKHTIEQIEEKLFPNRPKKPEYKDTLSHKVEELLQKQKQKNMIFE